MIEYKAKYVCRLCGAEIFVAALSAANDTMAYLHTTSLAYSGKTKTGSGSGMTLHEAHNCPDGNVGLADFQGFVMEVKNAR